MAQKITLVDEKELIEIKKSLAYKLSKTKSQSEIAKILNITQPMVSNYLKSRPQTITNINPNYIHFYSAITNKPITSSDCFLATEDELISDNKLELINNLTEFYTILKDKNIKSILPKIKINIAYKLNNTVASFSNGLLIINDRIALSSEIVFNKSRHLANLLTYIQSLSPNAKAIMNIKYNNYNNPSKFTKNYKLNEKPKDIILHKGDFGIEPCAYIIGITPKDIAKKLLQLL